MSHNVLVTGGAGFIGAHLVRRLVERGDAVRVLDDFSTGRRARLSGVESDVEVIVGDVRRKRDVEAAMRDVELAFHLAAIPSVARSLEDPLSTSAATVEGTLNVLLAARAGAARRVVHASSSSVYGDAGALPRAESARPAPISPYAVAKLAAEGYCQAFARTGDLETTSLRYFNVFGPGQDPRGAHAAAVPRFIAALEAGEPVVLYGDGGQTRDFTYVGDVVEATLLAAEADDLAGAVLNVGAGRPLSVTALAEAIADRTGRPLRLRRLPARPYEVRASCADRTEVGRRLGWEPRTSLETGLDAAVRAFRDARRAGRQPARAARPRHLVTGGAGFVGSHLVEALAARGDAVLVLDDLSTGRRANIEHLLGGDGVELVEGSVLDGDLVADCMRKVDTCFHLAAAVGVELIIANPLDSLIRNVRGSDVVISAAARLRRPLLFTSSSEIYGKTGGPALTEAADCLLGAPSKSRWAYAHAKAFGEALTYGYCRQDGQRMVVARLFNTIGPRQSGAYGMVLPRFVEQALAGRDVTVYGDGAQSRCFCHVSDTVDALVRLMHCEAAAGRPHNVGSSTELTVLELARLVIRRLESSSEVRFVPYDEAYDGGFEELARRRPDTAALRDLTGWEPRRTIADAIDEVAASQGAAPRRDASLVG